MRTLKKTLSLVLVVAMVLGLCVVGASAKNAVDDYKDADKIGDAYYEAVGVMTGIGVIKGMGDGILSPTGNYTRAQAAKIITYMLIGEKAAESLVCTTAPFEDVAANHWAAGYIAFCVEKGIINGMSATTFDPEGQLTGFQWAKMLLCAVGFGSQGEFTGNSWSLNTAFVAHRVGLFNGDLAGADHVALQRQQAMLYAFNVLTTVPQVAYAPGITGYIEGVDNYKPVTDLGKPLGESIYKLKSVTGVIVNNEAMGSATTNVNVEGGYTDYAPNTVSVKANTGLDMMYHAARIWYVEGTKANTGVCVIDLAKTETTGCPTKAATGALKIGDTSKTLYEAVAVDNTAIDAGKKTVEFYACVEYINYTSTLNDYSNFNVYYGKVDNDYILTDVSAVTAKTPLVVIKAGDKAYHVYATTTTAGSVTGYSELTGVITLSDGTKLSPSNLNMGTAAAIARLKEVLAGKDHVAPTYAFVLDTHGHYMYLTENNFRTVAYFTGVLKDVSAHGSWSNEVAYVAQFVDVEDATKVEEIPVTKEWAVNALNHYDLSHDRSYMYGYYDITDELYGDATYAPEMVFYGTPGTIYHDWDYANKYAFSDNVYIDTYNTANPKLWIHYDGQQNLDYFRYDPDTVVFYIAYGAGNKLEIETYVGVDALLAGFAEKYNTTVSAVSLDHVAMTYAASRAGNNEVLTVFGYEDTYAQGEFLFFPTDVTKFEYHDDYILTYAYLNGNAEKQPVRFDKDYFEGGVTDDGHYYGLFESVIRGFYWYSIDANGNYAINRVPSDEQGYWYNAPEISIESAGSYYFINDIPVSKDFKVIDTRSIDDKYKIETVEELASLIKENMWNEANIQLAYMVWGEKDEIAALYVVDKNLGVANITIDDTVAGWKFFDGNRTGRFEDGTVKLYNDGLAALDEGTVVTFEGEYYLNGNAYDVEDFIATGKVVKPTPGKPYVAVTVDGLTDGDRGYENANITIDEAYYVVKVDNKQTEFSVNYKCGDMASSAAYPTTGIEMPVGGALDLAFLRGTVAAGIASKVAYVNNTTAATAEVNSIAGQIWINFIPKGNTVTINSITAELTLSLGNKDNYPAMLFNFYFDGCDAEDDTLKTTFVPGSALPLRVQRSGSEITGQDGSQLQFTTTKSGTITSVTTVDPAKDTSNMVFVFEDYVPKANSDLISGMKWVGEVKP